MTDLTADELTESVIGVSQEAFDLARAAAMSGDFAADEARARELNDRLDELWPRVEAAPATAQPVLGQAWSDARLDLGYLLSGGALPTSIRLNHLITERSRS